MTKFFSKIVDTLRTKNSSIVPSYKALRTLIGVLGILLPLICFLGGLLFEGFPVQKSISSYYHTNVRDFFVGLLVCVGFFLMTYKGYELIDDIVTTASGAAGFCIAIFPCLVSKGSTAKVGFFQLNPDLSNILHLSCAAVFFTLLALNSLFLFTMTDPDKAMSGNKKKRNLIYRICGLLILACELSLLILVLVFGLDFVDGHKIVFIGETVMLAAFGVSWLVKGETILKG